MFMFNKNNAPPRSRQSSVDSLTTDPSTASNSEFYASQCSDASTQGDLPSFDQRSRTHSAKRNSIFNLRSRSNTATSTTSSFVSVTSPGMLSHEAPSRRTSQDFHHLAGQSYFDLPTGKRAIFRGKKGKRVSGSDNGAMALDETEDADDVRKRTSVLRRGRRFFNHSENLTQNLRHRISSPFDFQHLTHTDRHQFAALEQASETELVAEYMAVRASQAPRRDLHGIRAENLHFNNFSSENLSSSEPQSTTASAFVSPPRALSPDSSHDQQALESPTHDSGKSLRLVRSVESFSQPGVSARAHRHTQSANAPPRSSSRLPVSAMDDVPEEHIGNMRTPPPIRARSNRHSGIWDHIVPTSTCAFGEKLTSMSEEPGVGHALTTPDDSAIHTSTPPFTPGLDDVAEEPERFVSPRPAPCPPVRVPRSPKSPFFESFSFGNQRAPLVRQTSRKSSFGSPKSANPRSITRPMSQMSDTLGSPTLPRRKSIRRAPSVRRKSNTWRVMEESWEDNIDYIYDNALEADCEFDWDRPSEDDEYEDREQTSEHDEHDRPMTATSQDTQTPSMKGEDETCTQYAQNDFSTSLLVPSASSVPELELRSAVSASTIDSTVLTPCDLFNSMSNLKGSCDAEGFSLTPSLLIPNDFKEQMSREEMYDDLLADYEGSEKHFPLLDAHRSIASSARSSRVRSSKRSSYDSSLISSLGQSSGSWSSPIRRSASSSGSLPELIHSRRARRNFDMVVDHLSEQVASFTAFNEQDVGNDEDNTTPPGHTAQDRTFFTAEEQSTNEDVQLSIEGEVRASLELARCGSTCSSRAPLHYHKYASSDGAAKILASPMSATSDSPESHKTRGRAASSSNAVRSNRKPYLSLFPTPPRHSPLPASPIALSPASS